MKDYLKDYLAGRRREEFPEHSRRNEVPKVTEAVFFDITRSFGTFGTCQVGRVSRKFRGLIGCKSYQ
jgi:hypothetical protein